MLASDAGAEATTDGVTGAATGALVVDTVVAGATLPGATTGVVRVAILLHLSTGGTASAAVAKKHRHEASRILDMAVARSGTCLDRCA